MLVANKVRAIFKQYIVMCNVLCMIRFLTTKTHIITFDFVFTAAYLVPKTFPGRCVYIFLFLLSVIVYNSYTSVLVSTLVGGPSKTDIISVWKLADSNLNFRADNALYMKGYLEV